MRVEKTSRNCQKTRKYKEMQGKLNSRLGNTPHKPDKTNPCGMEIAVTAREMRMEKMSISIQKTRKRKEMQGTLKLRLGTTSPTPDKATDGKGSQRNIEDVGSPRVAVGRWTIYSSKTRQNS